MEIRRRYSGNRASRLRPARMARSPAALLLMTEAPQQLLLRCRCGHVRGLASGVAPDAGFRFVCYCGDCQAFARFLARPDVLDAAGGTDIFHMPAGHVKLTEGADAVRCLHFSSRVFRWYAQCCRTPIANTAGPRFPVVGLIHSFMDHKAAGRHRDRCSARRCAGSSKAPPPRRCRRTRRRRTRSASSRGACQHFSAGGCAGSAGRTRSSTKRPVRRSPRRACSRRKSAPP